MPSNFRLFFSCLTLPACCLMVLLCPFFASAQLPDSCQLNMGINLAGVADFSREIPFANMIKMARTWYTKGENDPSFTWDTGFSDVLSYDENGYPTHIPQSVTGSDLPQQVATVWDGMDSWPPGTYTLLWDGNGDFDFWGDYQNLVKINDNRYELEINPSAGSLLQLTMIASEMDDPVRNLRLLLPGTEATYETQPFNPGWLEEVRVFRTLRFMDWGHTNFWGQPDDFTWQVPELADWEDRASPEYYTYTTNKGVPYELMAALMNELEVDGWVCVPHLASDDYIENMASLFKNQVHPDRQIYVEYSNELWNWIFGQAQWLNEYPCAGGSATWPECIVPNIQNTLDIWSAVFGDGTDRLQRVAAIQTGWLDVSERIATTLRPGSFDLLSPTFYFGFTEASEIALDNLGENATVSDIAYHARLGMNQNMELIRGIQNIAESLEVPVAFYEGGQHLTPHPFGQTPTYANALVGIHRDTAMYNLYNEWTDSIRSIHSGTDPMLLTHFSFITPASARFGSWGLLETMNQNRELIPAPKYESVMENMGCTDGTTVSVNNIYKNVFTLFPNPAAEVFSVDGVSGDQMVEVLDLTGRVRQSQRAQDDETVRINIGEFGAGLYLVRVVSGNGVVLFLERLVKPF